MVSDVCPGKDGAVAVHEVSCFARNSTEWQRLVEASRVVDTLLFETLPANRSLYSISRLQSGKIRTGLLIEKI